MKLLLNFLAAPLRKPIALAKAAAAFMNDKLLAWLAWIAKLTRLDRLFPWRYFWLVSRPYWTGESSKKAKLLLAVTVALMIASIKAAYYIGVTLKDFTEAINSSAPGGDQLFFVKGGWLLIAVVVWTAAAVFYSFFRSWLIWDWRISDSNMRIRQWLTNEAFLREQIVSLGNQDQRLIQDPDLFTEKAVLLPMALLESGYGIWTFAPLLMQSSAWLAMGCIGFAVVTYVMVFLLGRSLASLMGQRYESEAVSRTYLQRAAGQSVAISLQRNEKLVLAQADAKLQTLKGALWAVMSVNRNVSLWQTFWGKVVEHGPFALIGWFYLHRQITSFGSILQGVQAFQSVYSGLTVFAANWEGISLLRAECERLGPFVQALEDIGANRMPDGQWIEHRQGAVVTFKDVTVHNQYIGSKPVVVGLNLTVDDNVLFTATDGQGKPELAKAIGLGVARGTGEITRPEREKIMFLTQSPFIPECTLREFLTDGCPEACDESALSAALAVVELRQLAEQSGGLDARKDWKTSLPLPQQQQLCLARLILAKPDYAVLEQATDAFEEEYENKIYSVLKVLGVKIVAFSNAVRVAKHVDRVIELSPDGTWEESRASEYHVPRWKTLLSHLTR